MSDIAIRVEGLGKQYRIGTPRARYGSLRDSLSQAFTGPFKRLSRNANGASATMQSDTIWALREVSFEANRGEVIGIIGRNGAGKSTLLKVLSRITEPTSGEVDIYGRVGSLLEVGTGFHPELTGRENIFLNGAILGMRRAEIESKFEEIAAFAEIEKFLDTPVKHYSSGMYMRLAFSVAAHLESEILVVDEVLAVGDSQFQKRCLGRMEEMRSLGRTVLFVSHNMPAVLRLCNRVVLLDNGSIAADGEPNQVARYYLQSESFSHAERTWAEQVSAPGDSVARLRAVRVRNHKGDVSDSIDIRMPISVEIEYWNLQSQPRSTAILHFMNEDGVCLFATNDFSNLEWFNTPRSPGIVSAVCNIPGNFFAEGRIFVLAALGTYNPNVVHAMVPDAVSFQIVDQTEGDGVRGEHVGQWPGVLRPLLDWQIRAVTPD